MKALFLNVSGSNASSSTRGLKFNVSSLVHVSLLLLVCAGLTSCNQDEFYEKEFLENPYKMPESTGGSDGGGHGGVDSGADGSAQGGADAGVSGGTEGGSTTGSSDNGGSEGGDDGNTTGGATGGVVGGSEGGTDGSTEGGAQGGTPGQVIHNKQEAFQQSDRKKLDILWVIDNSGSMSDEQAALGYNFDAFINDFISTQVDFKMAITTTDTSSASKKGAIWKDSDVKLTSARAQASPNQFKNDFRNLVKVGINGSGTERGLAATEGFLEKSLSFLRPDAYLAVVILSDEEDQSQLTPVEYVNKLKAAKSEAGLVKVYSICDVNRTNSGSGIKTGCTRYAAASEATSGEVSDIRGDFHQVLSEMGDSLINLLDSFALAHKPILETLAVRVNGDLVTGYTYDSVTNSIKFNSGFVPPVGSTVQVTYQWVE